MNFKEKYINEEILEKIVIPFYKKYLPDVYDENMDIYVNINDNVPKDNQRIYSSRTDFSIRYDTAGKIENINNIGEQYVVISEQIDSKCDLKCRRKLLDSVIIAHECAHQYSGKNLWKYNESYLSSGRIYNMIRNGKISKEDTDKLLKIPEGYGLFDIGEAFAKCCELKLINEMFKDGKITKEENNNILSFEQKYKSNPPYEVGNAFYNLLNQVGENKFVELIKNYDIFEHFKFNKNDANSKEIYFDFLKNPLGYMQKIQINKDRKNDKENVRELLNIIENSEKNNSVIKNEDSFRSQLGKLVNKAGDDVILPEDGDDNLEKRKKECKEKEV